MEDVIGPLRAQSRPSVFWVTRKRGEDQNKQVPCTPPGWLAPWGCQEEGQVTMRRQAEASEKGRSLPSQPSV